MPVPSVAGMADLPPLLTTAQLADWLTEMGMPVKDDTIRNWCLKKRIPAVRTPSREWRIRREDAEAILVPNPAVQA